LQKVASERRKQLHVNATCRSLALFRTWPLIADGTVGKVPVRPGWKRLSSNDQEVLVIINIEGQLKIGIKPIRDTRYRAGRSRDRIM